MPLQQIWSSSKLATIQLNNNLNKSIRLQHLNMKNNAINSDIDKDVRAQINKKIGSKIKSITQKS